MNEYARESLRENLDDALRQWRDVVIAHDSVHPDRGDCGGVGGCALLRAEHDAHEDVTDAFEHAFRAGVLPQIAPIKEASDE